ncbi:MULTISPECIES: hypothetical protein [unclassified Spirillospora]|uniref:hypothetical protein n=1 Tax=unclassified Spirillospora TaxID=2642701 RepID=UPI003714B31D
MKRGHVAALALMLALAGCGGSGDGGGAAESPGPSSSSSGKGTTVLPTPPGQSKAAKAFNDCMRKQGVELPSPNPTATPAEKEIKKRMTALRACMKALSSSPPAQPR